MPKRKNLNGLPHNLTKSFFGTKRYYKGGYMPDWLLNAARKLQLKEATIDILNQTIHPTELNLYPLKVNLKDLPIIIDKELKENGFASDFIIEAKIRVDESGRLIVDAYEETFNPFDPINIYTDKPSFFDKIKSIFN